MASDPTEQGDTSDTEVLSPRAEPDRLSRAVARARIAEKLFARKEEVVVGRYHLLEQVGEGGAGIVWGAWDPELDRRVAIKLVRATHAAARERIVAEGHALAKISHPNVVPIHDVGVIDEHVYLVMEWVRGKTLRAWASEPHSAREIVAVYRAAGEGIAAAHRGGLIHRDFKPDNAMLGDDGRVRVLDFGLARTETELERGGAVAGTPRYMAPEQTKGRILTAAVDQYAFGVSLREALGDQVPGWIAAIVARATAEDPADRYASFQQLLAALARDPRLRRRRLAIAGLAVIATAGAVAVPLLATRSTDPCEGGEERIAAAWNPERAAAVVALGPLAPIARERLDRFTRDWVVAEHQACAATRVAATQSESMLDRRMLCLHRAHAQLAAVVAAVTTADPNAVEHAPEQLALLPDLAACADVASLGAQAPLPADRDLRTKLEQLGAQLATMRSRVLLSAPIPVADADILVATAQGLGWAPLVAEAIYVRALVIEQGGVADTAAFEAAAVSALTSSNDEIAAYAMADLAWKHAGDGDRARASSWAALAEAVRLRLGRDPALGARIAGAQAIALANGPHPAEALAMRRRQVELAREAFSDPLNEATNHLSLAIGHHAAGQPDDALREAQTGLAQAEGLVGPEHPELIEFLEASSSYAMDLGKLAVASELAQREIAIIERRYGPESRKLTSPLIAMAGIAQRRGDPKRGRDLSRRALAILDRTDPGSPDAGGLVMNLGLFAAQLGELDAARAYADRALAVLEPLWGKDNPQLIDVYVLIGYVARGQQRLDDSTHALEHAVALADAAGAGVDRSNPRIELAETLRARGKAADAVRLLTALVDAPATTAPPQRVAELQGALAAARWAAGDRAGARLAGQAAVDAWTSLGADAADQRTQAERWLRAHP